jgi:hypothetical protein
MAAPGISADLEGSLAIGATATDNLFQAPEEGEDEIILRLEPTVFFAHESERLNAAADYRMQAYRYTGLGRSDVYHQYNAFLLAALVPDVLFLDLGANRTQSIVDPEAQIPSSILPISINRQDRDEYYVSPVFEYAFGRGVSVRAQYRHNWLDYSEDSVSSSEDRDGLFSIENYRHGRGLTWAMRYSQLQTEYEDSLFSWEYRQAMAELGFWAGSNLRLFASAGKESAWDTPLDPSLKDDVWEAGFAYKSKGRFSAEFATGERSFGPSWRGSLTADFRRISTAISYAERPTTTNRRSYQDPDFTDPVAPNDLLGRPGQAASFISKRFDWLFQVEANRTKVLFGLYDETRTDKRSFSGQPLADEAQRGFNLSITYRLGSRTEVTARGSLADWDLQPSGERRFLRGWLSAKYDWGSRTSVTLEYQYGEQDSLDPTIRTDYVINSISLMLSREF